jgi:Lon protease-like protein
MALCVLRQVEIIECQAMPDGRYGLEIVGRQRFRMPQGTTDQDGYRVAQPSFFGDDPLEENSAKHAEAKALKEELDALTVDFVAKIR